MYRIFIQNKPVYLIADQKSYQLTDGSLFMLYDSKEVMRFVLSEFEKNPPIKSITIVHPDINELFKDFSSLYTLIEAAGGVVKNPNGQTLMIFRNGKWDLPKGKLEKGESPEAAAVREVEEECGITGLKITKDLESTWHTYHMDDKEVLKKTYWYEMSSSGTDALKPQTDEGITEVKWMNESEVKQALKNSYTSVELILKGTH